LLPSRGDQHPLLLPGDQVIEDVDAGSDTVITSVTYTLPDNVEKLVIVGTTALDGFGNDLNNTLVGDAFANKLMGRGGSDILDGRAGDDELTGGTGPDLFDFRAGFGHDKITDLSNGDRIQFHDGLFQNPQAVLDASRQVGADTVITLDPNNTVTLQGVQLSSLHPNDFLIVA
jgi:Ca2+-binding RTX toxin-like protein